MPVILKLWGATPPQGAWQHRRGGRMTPPVYLFLLYFQKCSMRNLFLTVDDPDSFWGGTAKTKRASVVISYFDRESLGLQNEEMYFRGEKTNNRRFRYKQDKVGRQ